MKQNRLKSLKICQSIRYKRLLEASGFSKRYGIFFGHTETVSYTSVSLRRQQMIEATVNIAYLVKESPRQLLAPISHQRQVRQLNHVTVTVDDLHSPTLGRFNTVGLVYCQASVPDRTRIFSDRADNCLVEVE